MPVPAPHARRTDRVEVHVCRSPRVVFWLELVHGWLLLLDDIGRRLDCRLVYDWLEHIDHCRGLDRHWSDFIDLHAFGDRLVDLIARVNAARRHRLRFWFRYRYRCWCRLDGCRNLGRRCWLVRVHRGPRICLGRAFGGLVCRREFVLPIKQAGDQVIFLAADRLARRFEQLLRGDSASVQARLGRAGRGAP